MAQAEGDRQRAQGFCDAARRAGEALDLSDYAVLSAPFQLAAAEQDGPAALDLLDRLLHSLNVSYLAWLIAKKLHCDAAAAARAGLLHDFCLYDFKDGTPNGEFQAFYHPKAAAENSEERFELSEKEKNAILSHMFPLGPIPKSREAWIISTADKICASAELCSIAIALARRGRVEISPAV